LIVSLSDTHTVVGALSAHSGSALMSGTHTLPGSLSAHATTTTLLEH
jgi:hypothetical protein